METYSKTYSFVAGQDVDIFSDNGSEEIPYVISSKKLNEIRGSLSREEITHEQALSMIVDLMLRSSIVNEKRPVVDILEPSPASLSAPKMRPSAKMTYETKQMKLEYESTQEGSRGRLYARQDPRDAPEAKWILIDDAITSFGFNYNINHDDLPEVHIGFKAF